MIESKVKWATVGTFVVGLVVAALNVVQDSPGILSPLPAWVQALVIALAPALVTFLSGYVAPHTDRLPPGQHRP